MSDRQETATSRARKAGEFIANLPIFVFAGVAITILAIHKFYKSKWMEYMAFAGVVLAVGYAVVFHTTVVVEGVKASPGIAKMVVSDLMPELAYVLVAIAFFAVVGAIGMALHPIDLYGENTLQEANNGENNE